RVQGFQADEEGNLNGVRNDIVVNSSNLAPRGTDMAIAEFNLDSRQPVLVERGTTLDTEWSGALSNDPTADDFYAGRSIDPAASAVDRFPPQRWTLTYADGRVSNVTAPPLDPENPPNALNYSAGDIANILSAQDGINASASTMVAIPIDPAFYDL